MTADVFISYSREDKDRVTELASKLREAGVSLWIDQGGIDGAAMWSEEIVNALEDAKVLMLMVSERAVISHNVVKEVTIASERKGHILPVHLEPTRIPQGLKYPLAGIQHIEYFQGDETENLKSILRALERLGIEAKPQAPEVAAGGTPQTASHSMHSTEAPIEHGALAVLPFDNISPDKETDYFSDGLTEELIGSLSVVSNIELVSRWASMQYKDVKKDLKVIGRELGARFIVGGSVRKFQENVRITAQLVDIETNRQLWGNTYKGKLEDIFEIQENVAKQIVEALSIKLTMVQEIALTKRATDSAEALDLYMRGREFRYKSRRKNLEFAIELFQKAIELDTRYANAYAGLSEAHASLYENHGRKLTDLSLCAEASLRAIMYDSASAEAHAALGLTYFYQGSISDAEQACLKAIELNPDLFMGYRNLGRIYHLIDRDAEAAQMLTKAIQLKPDDYLMMSILGGILGRLGRNEENDEWQNKMLELLPRHLLRDPEDISGRVCYAIALASANRRDEALEQAKVVLDVESNDGLTLYNVACIFSQLGDLDRAVEGLRSAFAAGHENSNWIKRDSDLDPIRNHPGYIELMKDK